jgi:hypothetical protein
VVIDEDAQHKFVGKGLDVLLVRERGHPAAKPFCVLLYWNEMAKEIPRAVIACLTCIRYA